MTNNVIYKNKTTTELNQFSVEESKITISTHDWIDKPINGQAFHYKTHELFYPNLGDNWYSLTDTVENIIDLISRQGRPYCAELVSSIRNNDNFKQTNLILLDDDNSNINDLKQHPLFLEYGCVIYPSPSCSIEQNKSRMLFVFDEPLNKNEYTLIYNYLLSQFTNTDKSCKNLGRHFNGTFQTDDKLNEWYVYNRNSSNQLNFINKTQKLDLLSKCDNDVIISIEQNQSKQRISNNVNNINYFYDNLNHPNVNQKHNEMLKVILRYTTIRNLKQINTKTNECEKFIWALNLVYTDFELYEQFFNLTTSSNPTENAKSFRIRALKELESNNYVSDNLHQWLLNEYKICKDMNDTNNLIFPITKPNNNNITHLTKELFDETFSKYRFSLLIADTGLGKNKIHINRDDTIILTSLKTIVNQSKSSNNVNDFLIDGNNTFTYDQSKNLIKLFENDIRILNNVEYLIIDEFHNFYISEYRWNAINATIKLINWILIHTNIKVVCQTATFFNTFCDTNLFNFYYKSFDFVKQFNKIDKNTIDYYYTEKPFTNKHIKSICDKIYNLVIEENHRIIIFFNDALALAKFQSKLQDYENINTLFLTTKEKNRRISLADILESGNLDSNTNVILTTSAIQEGVSFYNDGWECQTIFSFGNSIEQILQIAGRFRKNKHTDIIHFKKSGNEYRILNERSKDNFNQDYFTIEAHRTYNKIKYYYLKYDYFAKQINETFNINHKGEIYFNEDLPTYNLNDINHGVLELAKIYRVFLEEYCFDMFNQPKKFFNRNLNIFFDEELGVDLIEFQNKHSKDFYIIRERFERRLTSKFFVRIKEIDTKQVILLLYDEVIKSFTKPIGIKLKIKKEKQQIVNNDLKEIVLKYYNEYKCQKLFKDKQLELCKKILKDYFDKLVEQKTELNSNDFIYSYLYANKTIKISDNEDTFDIVNEKSFKYPTLIKSFFKSSNIICKMKQKQSKNLVSNNIERYLIIE